MGMLFDHGCDAFVAIFNSFLLIRMFTLGTNPYQIFLVMIALFPFYFVTMEQYYTGEMNFPPIWNWRRKHLHHTLCMLHSIQRKHGALGANYHHPICRMENASQLYSQKLRDLYHLCLRIIWLGEHLQKHTQGAFQSYLQTLVFRCLDFLLFFHCLHNDNDASL